MNVWNWLKSFFTRSAETLNPHEADTRTLEIEPDDPSLPAEGLPPDPPTA